MLALKKFLIILPLFGASLAHAGTDFSSQAQSDWDFLREASKEVELYLPNEANVNETEQTGEIVDEISLKKAGIRKESAPEDGLRHRSLTPEEPPNVAAPKVTPKLNSAGLRYRSR